MPARSTVNGDYRPKARQELQRKLRAAVELEGKVGDEIDRLLSLAFEQNWTDADIVQATGFPRDVVRGARSRGGHRLPTIFCKGCGDAIPRTGRRGRPASYCDGCKP